MKPFKNLVVRSIHDVTFSSRQLALIARQFQPNSGMRCKGQLAQWLSPGQLTECLRIRQLQRDRHERAYEYDSVNRLDTSERRGIKRQAWKTTFRWSGRYKYNYGFRDALAAPIQKSWKYRSRVKYSVDLHHSQTEVKYQSSRPACGYETLGVTLTFDLLRHRWQWIGGMLTISAKTDAGKRAYPCWWFQQRTAYHWNGGSSPGVGLEVKRGWIINGNYHVSAVNSEVEARRKKASIIRRAREKEARIIQEREERMRQREEEWNLRNSLNYRVPKGWVNRLTSLRAGNCEAGTDNFINSRLAPYFQQAGCVVGDLRGLSIRVKLLLEIERSAQTRRVAALAK